MPTTQALISQMLTGRDEIALRVRFNHHPPERRRISLALPSLDAATGGGFPRGAITEVFGAHSSGKTTLAHALIASTIRLGGLAAWVDLPNSFSPEQASDRVLWVSPGDCLAALRATEHVLEAGGFHVVILDLAAPVSDGLTVPASRWLRMARAAARRDAVIVVLSIAHIVGAFATLSLEACANYRKFVGNQGPCPIFEGLVGSLHFRRCKHDAPVASVDVYASADM